MRKSFKHEGEYLKKCRKATTYTQISLGKELKIHPQFISNWERGKCSPPMNKYKKLIEVLNVDKWILRKKMVNDAIENIKGLKIFK